MPDPRPEGSDVPSPTVLSDALQGIPLELRWSDQDAYGHVNNVSYFRLLEEARFRFFTYPLAELAQEGSSPDDTMWTLMNPDTKALVARNEIEYRQQLEWQAQPVHALLRIPAMGGSSFDVSYTLMDAAHEITYVVARTTMVQVNMETGRPVRLGAQMRKMLPTLDGEITPFRPRG
jgi:acyl-CoA thioester hydrolase